MISRDFSRGDTLRIAVEIIILGILLIILMPGGAFGATSITQCGKIDSSGDYVLTEDIWNAGNSAVLSCINITSSNVNFDGASHFIVGNSAAVGIIGVYVNNATSLITNVTVKNLNVKNLGYGFYLHNSFYNNFTGNNASNNSNGIYLWNSSNNNIFNNYFNNSINVSSVTSTNYWNTTKQSAINIINGPNIGGNFWANPEGNGFSQTCANTDGDGICDSSFVINPDNIDHLPLTNITTTLPPYRYINGTVLDNVTLAGIQGVTVSINTGNSTVTNASGFYSFNVTSGTFNLTAVFEPKYYPNNSSTISTTYNAVVLQDIILVRKPTGTITGKVVRYSFIRISSPQDITYNTTDIPLIMSADRAIATWEYSLNGAPNVTFTPGTNITAIQGWNDLVVFAQDLAGKCDSNSVSFFVDSIAPGSVTNLQNVSYATNYINWTWTDPSDPDFARVIVYLDSENKGEVLKGQRYYNASGLVPGRYTIGTRTVDEAGNINTTMQTHTATTMMPPERYINGSVMDSVNKTGIQGVTVITSSFSTITNETGFYSLKVVSGTFDIAAEFEPTYYTNSSVTVSTEFRAVMIQDIELQMKPTGNITGNVTIG